jgi:hypothetical protein
MTLKELYQSINKREWHFVGAITIIAILLTSLPYLFGWLVRGNDYFLGFHSLSSGDISVYYSYLEQVKQGHFLFKDLYTSEFQGAGRLNIFWLGVGLFGRIFNLPDILTFHLARILLIPVFGFVAYLFLSYFFLDKAKRKISYLFLIFASGWGGIFSQLLDKFYFEKAGYSHWPPDLWVPESNTFLTLYQSPHFIASVTLVVLIFLLMLLAFENNKIKYSISAGLAGLALFQFHPFNIFVIFGALGLYIAALCSIQKKIRWQFIKHYVIFSLLSALSIIYYLYLLKFDWLTIESGRENLCLTPALFLIIIGYGLIIPLAIFGYYSLSKNKEIKNSPWLFLIIWAVFQFFLIYSPVNFERRMIEGWQIPLILLAISGLYFVKSKLDKLKLFSVINRNIFLLGFLFIVFFFTSNLFVMADDIGLFKTKNNLLYIPAAEKEAFAWIKSNVGESQPIFSYWRTGNLIPGQTGKTVYLGHSVETAYFYTKIQNIDWFLNTKSDEARARFLKANKIKYLYWGKDERSKSSFEPQKANFLEKVYSNNEVEIYKVL